ncbi:hypothetical protein FQZ97_708900 [compost metagenome]
MVLQCAFAVVGKHQHLGLGQQALDFGGEGFGVGVEGFLEVHAQQLLVPAHDPQLDDGRLLVQALEVHVDACSVEAVGEAVSRLVYTGDAHQHGRRTQGGDVQRDVGRAAGTVLDLIDLDHGHRRLGGNPRGAAMPVAVEHDVAHHQNGGLIESGHGQLHGVSGRQKRRGS